MLALSSAFFRDLPLERYGLHWIRLSRGELGPALTSPGGVHGMCGYHAARATLGAGG